MPENIVVQSYQDVLVVTETVCYQGYYCLIDSTTMTPCPPGTYNNLTNGNSPAFCLTCPQGALLPAGLPPASVVRSWQLHDLYWGVSPVQLHCVSCGELLPPGFRHAPELQRKHVQSQRQRHWTQQLPHVPVRELLRGRSLYPDGVRGGLLQLAHRAGDQSRLLGLPLRELLPGQHRLPWALVFGPHAC